MGGGGCKGTRHSVLGHFGGGACLFQPRPALSRRLSSGPEIRPPPLAMQLRPWEERQIAAKTQQRDRARSPVCYGPLEQEPSGRNGPLGDLSAPPLAFSSIGRLPEGFV